MKSKKSFLRGGGGLVALAILAVPIFAMSASAGLQENGGFSVRAHSQHGDKTLEHTVSGFGSGGTGSPVDPGGEVDESKTIAMVSAANIFTLALAKDGSVYSFGANYDGQLGLGGTGDPVRTPTKIPSLKDIKSIDSNSRDSVALNTSGEVYVWGKPYSQPFIRIEGNDYATPSKMNGLPKGIKEISIGLNHALAIDDKGDLWSWGQNGYGELGIGVKSPGNAVIPPTKVTFPDRVKQVSAGQNVSMVLLNDGSVYLFGSNSKGEIGTGNTQPVTTPHRVMDPGNDIISISTSRSANNFFMIKGNGEVYTMGANISAQLGLGHTGVVTTPTLNESLHDVSKVFTGLFNTFVLTKSGELYGFGIKTDYWIKDYNWGSFEPPITTPIKLDYATSADTGISTLSSSTYHAVFVMQNGEMRGLGKNEAGELGQGLTNPSLYGFTKIKMK